MIKYPFAVIVGLWLSSGSAVADVVQVNAWHVKPAHGGILYKVDYTKTKDCVAANTFLGVAFTGHGATELWPVTWFQWPHSAPGERVVIRYVIERPKVLVHPLKYRVVTHIRWELPRRLTNDCGWMQILESNEFELPR